MYAQVTMVGRVTQDLEMRTKANGTPYTQVNLAVNEGYGEHTHTSFYQCWLQGDEATRAGKAGVKKGSLLFLRRDPQRQHQDPRRQSQLCPLGFRPVGQKVRRWRQCGAEHRQPGCAHSCGACRRQPCRARGTGPE